MHLDKKFKLRLITAAGSVILAFGSLLMAEMIQGNIYEVGASESGNTFKVKVRALDVDPSFEHSYYAIAFLGEGTIQAKNLEFVSVSSNNLENMETNFVFQNSTILPHDKFLVCLVALKGGIEIDDVGCKLGINSPEKRAEILDFKAQ
jgi:hypothetical protein